MKKSLIALVCVLGAVVMNEFWAIQEGEKFDPIARFIYRKKSLAQETEVKTYLLAKEHILYMLEHPNEEIVQPSQKELYGRKVSLVFRVKGKADRGTLLYKSRDFGWRRIDLKMYSSDKRVNRIYDDIIIPAQNLMIIEDQDIPPPPIETEWVDLYLFV